MWASVFTSQLWLPYLAFVLIQLNASRIYASGPGPWEISPAKSGLCHGLWQIQNLLGFCLPLLSGQCWWFRACIIHCWKDLFNWNTMPLRLSHVTIPHLSILSLLLVLHIITLHQLFQGSDPSHQIVTCKYKEPPWAMVGMMVIARLRSPVPPLPSHCCNSSSAQGLHSLSTTSRCTPLLPTLNIIPNLYLE